MSEPLKVSISPKAMRTEWWISANGGQMKPAVSIAHPKAHNANAVNSCKRFIVFSADFISHKSHGLSQIKGLVLISAIRGRYIFPLGNPFSRFVLRLHQVPDVLAQGLVLALLFERHLVKRCLVWICQTSVHRFCDSTEHGLVINLCLRVLGRTLAVGLSVVEFTCLAVCKADLVALCHFAVDLLHWECIFYFCHSCSAISRID